MKTIINTLLSYVVDSAEITGCLKNVDCHFDAVVKSSYVACLDTENAINICQKQDIEMLIDFLHDELNTGHWSKVSLSVRHAFQAASFLKAIICLKHASVISSDALEEALKTVDLGLLLGAPLEKNRDLLNKCASLLSRKLQKAETKSEDDTARNKGIKRKYVSEAVFERLQAKQIDVLKCPSLEYFNKSCFEPQLPAKLQGDI